MTDQKLQRLAGQSNYGCQTTEWTRETARWYLAAMIDGEGCIAYRPGHSVRAIMISNTEQTIIAAVMDCCAVLGLAARLQVKRLRPPRKQAWEVSITGQRSMRLAAELLPLHSAAKAAKLAAAVSSYQRQEPTYSFLSHPETRARAAECLRLRRQGMTWVAIGRQLGFSEAAACRAAKRAEIDEVEGSHAALTGPGEPRSGSTPVLSSHVRGRTTDD